METQEQIPGTTIEAHIETESSEKQKTIRDDITAAITEQINDRELQLKLIATTESYLGGKENYSIPEFTQLLWDNFNEYKGYLENNNQSGRVLTLDPAFRGELMPKIVALIMKDREEYQAEQIKTNSLQN